MIFFFGLFFLFVWCHGIKLFKKIQKLVTFSPQKESTIQKGFLAWTHETYP
jgi:hypothetical protein